ncbi:MAG: tRNA pseudouridine(55) synthase TruB, partial [Wenyingzhuangia sp.]
RFTKKIETYQAQHKEYTGTITLGSTTPSYDLETQIDKTFPTEHITTSMIQETTKKFIGEIDQVPPIFSAIKKEGKRLYELARQGKTTEIKSRKITISEFEILALDFPNIHFRVACSKGTYIRSLAYDFGKALNSGSHLSALRRTKIGDFQVDHAVTINSFLEDFGLEADEKN